MRTKQLRLARVTEPVQVYLSSCCSCSCAFCTVFISIYYNITHWETQVPKIKPIIPFHSCVFVVWRHVCRRRTEVHILLYFGTLSIKSLVMTSCSAVYIIPSVFAVISLFAHVCSTISLHVTASIVLCQLVSIVTHGNIAFHTTLCSQTNPGQLMQIGYCYQPMYIYHCYYDYQSLLTVCGFLLSVLHNLY